MILVRKKSGIWTAKECQSLYPQVRPMFFWVCNQNLYYLRYYVILHSKNSIYFKNIPNALSKPLFTLNLSFILLTQLQNIIKLQLFAGGTRRQAFEGSMAAVLRRQRRWRGAGRNWGCADWRRRWFGLADMRRGGC